MNLKNCILCCIFLFKFFYQGWSRSFHLYYVVLRTHDLSLMLCRATSVKMIAGIRLKWADRSNALIITDHVIQTNTKKCFN